MSRLRPQRGIKKTEARMVRDLQRREQALTMRLAGYTLAEIGNQLGIDRSTVHKILDTALTDLREEIASQADQLRALELARLDKLLSSMWLPALGSQGKPSDLKAVDRVLRVLERRAKLLGLDAPTKIAPVMPDGETPYAPQMSDTERAARIAAIMTKALNAAATAAAPLPALPGA